MSFAMQPMKKIGESFFGVGGCALLGVQLDPRRQDWKQFCPLPFPTKRETLEKANELVPGPAAAMKCVRNTPSGRFTLCVKGKLIKPPDFKQPNADSLVLIAKTEQGNSEVSCMIDQDKQGFLKATPMIHTDDSRPSDFTFAHMAVQTDTCVDENSSDIPDELKQTIGNHLWLANLETSAGTPPDVRLKPQIPGQPHPNGPTAFTRSQLLDAQTQLEAAKPPPFENWGTTGVCLGRDNRVAGGGCLWSLWSMELSVKSAQLRSSG